MSAIKFHKNIFIIGNHILLLHFFFSIRQSEVALEAW